MGDPIRLNVWNRSWKCLLHRSTEDVGAADRVSTAMVIVKSGKGRQMPRIEARKVPNPRMWARGGPGRDDGCTN